jgi:hypothetical protein
LISSNCRAKEKLMNSITPMQMFEAVDLLPPKMQAACVCVAARMALRVWHDFEMTKYSSNKGAELLDAFEHWARGSLTNAGLKSYADGLFPLLPKNLAEEADPSPGMGGWAIQDVATIGLGEYGDVLDSVMRTGVLYAAGAVCGSDHGIFWRGVEGITLCELQFLLQWWEKCQGLDLLGPVQ